MTMKHTRKPTTCEGCPLYDNNDEFVKDSLPEGVRILVVYDTPSKDNAAAGGAGNDKQDWRARSVNAMKFTQLKRPYDTGFGHILRCRKHAPATEKNPPRPMQTPPSGKELKAAVAHCRVHDVIPDTIEAIVAYGPIAWKTLTDGVGARSKWRGYYHERPRPAGDYNEAQLEQDVRMRDEEFLAALLETDAADTDVETDAADAGNPSVTEDN
jgi:uracil-DNA glycosylase